jgi:hypothetical protein
VQTPGEFGEDERMFPVNEQFMMCNLSSRRDSLEWPCHPPTDLFLLNDLVRRMVDHHPRLGHRALFIGEYSLAVVRADHLFRRSTLTDLFWGRDYKRKYIHLLFGM